MTKSAMLWGAGLTCALGGAVAGNALGSTPVLDRPTIGSFYQTHEDSSGHEIAHNPPPDHYPLVTRAGTVPVGELSMRGLYSQARYRTYVYPADYALAKPSTEEYRFEDTPRFASVDESVRIGDAAPEDQGSESVAPLQLASGPADVSPQGNAKLIDVKATLAMR